MPTADLADVTDDVGTALAAELAFPLAERLSLSVDGNVDLLKCAIADRARSEALALRRRAGRGGDSPGGTAFVVISGGAKATTMDTGAIDPTETDGFNETYFGVNAGLEVGYHVTENVVAAAGRVRHPLRSNPSLSRDQSVLRPAAGARMAPLERRLGPTSATPRTRPREE